MNDQSKAALPHEAPFASSFDGGVDLKFSPHMAFRPEVDYISLGSNGQILTCFS